MRMTDRVHLDLKVLSGCEPLQGIPWMDLIDKGGCGDRHLSPGGGGLFLLLLCGDGGSVSDDISCVE